MKRQVSQRLGSGIADAEAIKSHQFFKLVNWDDVINRRLEPPIKPVLVCALTYIPFACPTNTNDYCILKHLQKSEDDVSQFDSKFTKQPAVDSPVTHVLSESANKQFVVSSYKNHAVLFKWLYCCAYFIFFKTFVGFHICCTVRVRGDGWRRCLSSPFTTP